MVKKLVIGALAVLIPLSVIATQQPGNEYGMSFAAVDTADTHKFRAVHCDSTQGTAHRYFHGYWSFINPCDNAATIVLYQLDGTTGAPSCSLTEYVSGGTCYEPKVLFDSCRVFVHGPGDSVRVTVVGDRDNTCNTYGGGSTTLP